MNKRTITVIQAPQGAGKTSYMRDEAISNGGLYVFACPTIELIREQVEWIKDNHKSYRVEEVHSKTHRQKSVTDEVEFRRERIISESVANAIIFITHEGLMSANFDNFSDWHLRIDEVPLAVQSGKISVSQSKKLYEDMLHQQVVNGDWAHYTLANKASWKAISGDDATSKHAEFYKQAQRETGVYINKTHWDKHNEIDWFSVWAPSYLTPFSTIEVAASNYLESLGVRAIEAFHANDCEFIPQTIGGVRTGQPDISIYYFTDTHAGNTNFWDTSDGRLCLKNIVDYLNVNEPDLGFWSGNDVVYKLMEHRVAGQYIAPKAMGLNKYRDQIKCAFIYSEKPQPSDNALKNAAAITDADIMNAREFETIRQFIMRGAIRNLDFDGDYSIYLYNKGQAEMVQRHLLNNGFQRVSIRSVNAGFVSTYTPPQVIRAMTNEEKTAHNRARKAQNKRDERARKKADNAP